MSRDLPEAEALHAIGESGNRGALLSRLAEAKRELGQIEQQFEPVRRGVALLQARDQAARQKHRRIVEGQIIEEREQLVLALVDALEKCVEINVQVSGLEQEMRAQGLPPSQSLVYPGLSHAWRGDEFNMGWIKDVLHTSEYSRWLNHCSSAGV